MQLGLHAPPLTWVEDVAIPVVATDAHKMEPVLAMVTESAVMTFRKFGLMLNFQHNKKTEAVISFRGDGAPALRHSLLVECLGHLALPSLPLTFHCVAAYEHLGTIFTDDGHIKAEVVHQKDRAIQAFHQVSKAILRNRHVSIVVRLKLFEQLIIPVLLHGAGNWPEVPARQFQTLHILIMKWQRIIINDGPWTDNQHTDLELQCTWKLAPLGLRLAKARILYAFYVLVMAL